MDLFPYLGVRDPLEIYYRPGRLQKYDLIEQTVFPTAFIFLRSPVLGAYQGSAPAASN
jgi:hypothetical protein